MKMKTRRSKMDRRRAQKTKSEHEHASENAPEKKQEHIRNGGPKVHKINENAPRRGSGGSKMRAWRAAGRFWAPCAPKVGARSGPSGPRDSKNSFGQPPPEAKR